ncbi:hypothetical protein F5Y10DRAFT_281636 [Nemania abortiva]|nr:hypothetical protein F5Y10DRAFT_281636 [Nemania abortiva]
MSNRLLATLGFSRHAHLWILRLLFIDSILCGTKPGGALPGECFYFLRSRLARLGITAHLWGILPAGILAGVQFVPAVHRPPLLRVHRAIGYASLVLALVGSLATLPIIRNAFGGDLAAQSATGLMLLLFPVAQIAGYVNIWRGNVYRHRHWMLRSWFYAGAVISMRILMALAALAISLIGGYYLAMPCDKINSILRSREETLRWYPECSPYFTGGDIARKVVVGADVFAPNVVPLVAAWNLSYGMSLWFALVCHVAGVEIYV